MHGDGGVTSSPLCTRMECSRCPVHPTLSKFFFEHTKKYLVRAQVHGVEPMILMTWADADKSEMTQGLDLTGATMVASVWNVNPVGSSLIAGLPTDVARHLQEVAWDTVRRYHGRQ